MISKRLTLTLDFDHHPMESAPKRAAFMLDRISERVRLGRPDALGADGATGGAITLDGVGEARWTLVERGTVEPASA